MKKICPECDGSGEVPYDQFMRKYASTCETCGGSGIEPVKYRLKPYCGYFNESEETEFTLKQIMNNFEPIEEKGTLVNTCEKCGYDTEIKCDHCKKPQQIEKLELEAFEGLKGVDQAKIDVLESKLNEVIDWIKEHHD